MNIRSERLTVFPTELAKRRFERRLVLEHGVLDTSRLFTQKKLMHRCEQAARRAGLLPGRSPGEAELRLLLEEAASSVRFAPGQPLAGLSPAARAGLLKRLIETFAVFAENEAALIAWFSAHGETHKLYGFGQLLAAWRAVCIKKQIADRFTVNAALLRLLQSGTLPNELEHGVQFRAVRWFNPFEERFAAALMTRLGPERVSVCSVLPPAHAEAAEDRLSAVLRSSAGEEWSPWVEDLADAFGADDGNIPGDEARERVAFFLSSNPYGEIEDAARRIARDIELGTNPDEIALILRDLSPYTDIVPHVFQRFGIPYHFRRGTPAAAHPPVKALLALLNFPQTRSRDRLCDLLLMPGIQWPVLDDAERQQLVREIRQTEPPRLSRLPKKLSGFFQYSKTDSFSYRANDLIKKHNLALPDQVLALIEELNQATDRLFDPERMIPLFEELLDNVTLRDELSTESGVWVINPMDAAGLRFQSVYLAGMDDRSFPQIPQADPLLNAAERQAFKKFLDERSIVCPRLALSETGTALQQEEILFLTALSAARERLTLSYTRADAGGKERAPGEFFERMRGLLGAGQPAHGDSFHTILPPAACRAEDEVRQTRAWAAMTHPKSEILNPRSELLKPNTENLTPNTELRTPNSELLKLNTASAVLIHNWLCDNPEFSATALEALARNRFIFFLEHILKIKPELTHEDDFAPVDRGSILHGILEQIYTAVAHQSGLYATCGSNGWKLAQHGEIPLAVFDPAKADDLLALARDIAETEFRRAEQQSGRHLGHPAVWNTEKRKLMQLIENFVRMDLETAQSENRYPALFEMKFDARHGLPVTLTREEEEVRLKGKIDRIDLTFDANGDLDRLLVIDYKSKSYDMPMSRLEKTIELNLDCQLPLYIFAAQQKFFGAHNRPELNDKVQAVYHLQERDRKEMAKQFTKKRLTLTPELTGRFLETLFSNVRKLREGDLAAEPLIAGYDDYSHICRTIAIDPDELLKSDS